jgi:hypothetical protein
MRTAGYEQDDLTPSQTHQLDHSHRMASGELVLLIKSALAVKQPNIELLQSSTSFRELWVHSVKSKKSLNLGEINTCLPINVHHNARLKHPGFARSSVGLNIQLCINRPSNIKWDNSVIGVSAAISIILRHRKRRERDRRRGGATLSDWCPGLESR